MINKKLYLIFALLSFTILTVSAQYSPQKTYEHESIFLKNAFGGLRYVKDGVEYHYGFFGNNYKQAIAVSPNAVVEFKKYRTNTLIGTGLSVVSAVLILSTVNANENADILFLSGLGVAVGSGIFFRDAGNNLNKSVWWYNRDILER
ncbi:MAG: hypothetical protein AAF847_16310 [Bacteroidota bacterium]